MNLTKQPKIKDLMSALDELQVAVGALYDEKKTSKLPRNRGIELKQKAVTAGYSLATHKNLARKWGKYDIVIPSYAKLRAQLLDADSIKQKIAAISPSIAQGLGVVLVPPTKVLALPLHDKLRHKKSARLKADILHISFNNEPAKQWRVLLCYVEAEGLYMGAPQAILQDKKYLIAKQNMLALGYVEYCALTMQEGIEIDQGSWTILFNNYDKKQDYIPGAVLMGDHYVFEKLELHSIFGNDRFRPAIEIK